MDETTKSYQQKVAARQAALNGELEQSSKFAELRAMHFRAFLNMRLWWQFWKTPARLMMLAHDCARLDYLMRVQDASDIGARMKEPIRAPLMANLLGHVSASAPAVTPLQLAQTVDTSPESGLQ